MDDLIHLAITTPFGPHQRGEIVTDPETVDQLLATRADSVLRIKPLHQATQES